MWKRKEMQDSTWAKSIIIIVLCGLAIVASVIIFIDPFLHYHESWISDKPYVTDEVYANPGLLDHMSYDSVLLGSSMVENFRVSWFDEVFQCSTVKTPYAGGYSKDYKLALERAYNNQAIENVFFGLDITVLDQDPDTTHFKYPEYLYNQKLSDDINYLLNMRSVEAALGSVKHFRNPNYDETYTWEKKFSFSEKEVLEGAGYTRVRRQPITQSEVELKEIQIDTEKLKVEKQNLDNLIPYIAEHPETTYYIFFPPYSIVFWKVEQDNLDYYLQLVRYIVEELSVYANVKLFYFQENEEIICNLDNYKDYTHYNESINRWMVEAMAYDEYRINMENCQKYINNLYELTLSYSLE